MDEEREQSIAEALRRDLPALWEYAQEELIVALLQKISPSPETQDLILRAHQTYTNARLRRDYVWWRYENPHAPVTAFLSKAPGFILPPLSAGGTRRGKDPLRLLKASRDYTLILAFLRFKNRVKGASQYRKLAARRQALREVLEEVLPSLTSQKQARELEQWFGQNQAAIAP